MNKVVSIWPPHQCFETVNQIQTSNIELVRSTDYLFGFQVRKQIYFLRYDGVRSYDISENGLRRLKAL